MQINYKDMNHFEIIQLILDNEALIYNPVIIERLKLIFEMNIFK